MVSLREVNLPAGCNSFYRLECSQLGSDEESLYHLKHLFYLVISDTCTNTISEKTTK